MKKTYIIKAYNGVEIIDNTPYAELRLSSMDYMEERYKRQQKESKRQQKISRNPLLKLAGMCGIL